jgi:hypothetical protein
MTAAAIVVLALCLLVSLAAAAIGWALRAREYDYDPFFHPFGEVPPLPLQHRADLCGPDAGLADPDLRARPQASFQRGEPPAVGGRKGAGGRGVQVSRGWR